MAGTVLARFFIAMLGIVFLAWMAFVGYRLWQKPRVHQSDPGGTSGLGLQVELEGNSLRITWNRDSPLIRSGAEGLLSIRDGLLARDLKLDSSELKAGSVLYLYSEQTTRVSVHLKIVAGGKALNDTILVLVAPHQVSGENSSVSVSSPGFERGSASLVQTNNSILTQPSPAARAVMDPPLKTTMAAAEPISAGLPPRPLLIDETNAPVVDGTPGILEPYASPVFIPGPGVAPPPSPAVATPSAVPPSTNTQTGGDYTSTVDAFTPA